MKGELIAPLIFFTPVDGAGATPSWEHLDWLTEAEFFFTLHPTEGRGGDRVGMVVIGADGRCWKILGVTAGGFAWCGPWPIKLLRSLLRLNRRHADYEVLELPSMSLDQIKDKVIGVITSAPDSRRDDEAIAGEDGEPRDEQEMLDERLAGVRKATTMKEIIDVLDV